MAVVPWIAWPLLVKSQRRWPVLVVDVTTAAQEGNRVAAGGQVADARHHVQDWFGVQAWHRGRADVLDRPGQPRSEYLRQRGGLGMELGRPGRVVPDDADRHNSILPGRTAYSDKTSGAVLRRGILGASGGACWWCQAALASPELANLAACCAAVMTSIGALRPRRANSLISWAAAKTAADRRDRSSRRGDHAAIL